LIRGPPRPPGTSQVPPEAPEIDLEAQQQISAAKAGPGS
jgi:hypothetical protein